MKVLFSLLLAAVVVVSTGWYVVYKSNPAKVCTIHPDKTKRNKYLRCIPGFDLPVNTFLDGYSPIERKRMLRQLRNGQL